MKTLSNPSKIGKIMLKKFQTREDFLNGVEGNENNRENVDADLYREKNQIYVWLLPLYAKLGQIWYLYFISILVLWVYRHANLHCQLHVHPSYDSFKQDW